MTHPDAPLTRDDAMKDDLRIDRPLSLLYRLARLEGTPRRMAAWRCVGWILLRRSVYLKPSKGYSWGPRHETTHRRPGALPYILLFIIVFIILSIQAVIDTARHDKILLNRIDHVCPAPAAETPSKQNTETTP